MWKFSSRWLPERYQTEMEYREGRLVPITYREEVISKGQHVQKEYRFDHESGHLSHWRLGRRRRPGQEMANAHERPSL